MQEPRSPPAKQVLETLELIEDHQIGRERVEPRLRQSDAQELDGIEWIFGELAPDGGRQVLSWFQPELLAEDGEERKLQG